MTNEPKSGAQCVEDESAERGQCDCAQLLAAMRPCMQCRRGLRRVLDAGETKARIDRMLADLGSES